jgi:hypothetical protein
MFIRGKNNIELCVGFSDVSPKTDFIIALNK